MTGNATDATSNSWDSTSIMYQPATRSLVSRPRCGGRPRAAGSQEGSKKRLTCTFAVWT